MFVNNDMKSERILFNIISMSRYEQVDILTSGPVAGIKTDLLNLSLSYDILEFRQFSCSNTLILFMIIV